MKYNIIHNKPVQFSETVIDVKVLIISSRTMFY